MMPIVSRAQMHVGNVRVDLRRRNVGVAQQCLQRDMKRVVLQQPAVVFQAAPLRRVQVSPMPKARTNYS